MHNNSVEWKIALFNLAVDVDQAWRERAELLEYSEGWWKDLWLWMSTQPYLLFPVLFEYKFIIFF